MAGHQAPKRTCTDCGLQLSMYSDDDRCASCQRSFLERRRTLPPVPDQVWADREVREALARWDLGVVARLVRERSGLRQEAIAHMTGLSQGFLSQLESGTRKLIDINKIIGFLDGLGTPAELLPRPSQRPREDAVADPVATVASHPADREDGLEPLVRVADLSQIAERIRWLRATNVNDESLHQLQSLIREVAEIYEEAGARGIYEVVLRQRQNVDVLLRGHQAPAHRAELLVIAGRLTVLLGHLAFDLSSDGLADAYSAEAWTIGDVCGDDGLRSSARSAQSFMAYYRGDYRDAAGSAADAVRYAGTRPEGVQAAVHQARAHARLGDRDAVDRALGRAFELRSSLSEPDEPHPFLAFEPYDTARIAGNAATAYLSLGATEQVVDYAEEAIPALAACGSRAGQALTHLDTASAHIVGDTPDLERAAAEAHHAIATAGGLRSAVLTQRGREFLAIADRWREVPAISAAADHVHDWVASGLAAEPHP